MKDYGVVIGSVIPNELEVNNSVVRIASNVREVETEYEGETRNEYEYNLVEYDKNEYIYLIHEEQSEQDDAINYLLMGGEE